MDKDAGAGETMPSNECPAPSVKLPITNPLSTPELLLVSLEPPGAVWSDFFRALCPAGLQAPWGSLGPVLLFPPTVASPVCAQNICEGSVMADSNSNNLFH